MVYLTDTRDVNFFRRLAKQGAVVLVGTTTETVTHVMGLRGSYASSVLVGLTMEEEWIDSDNMQTDMWQSAVRREITAKILSLVFEEEIETSKAPVTLEEEDVLIFLAPEEEQSFLSNPNYCDPFEMLDYVWFYIVFINKIVPELKEIVI